MRIPSDIITEKSVLGSAILVSDGITQIVEAGEHIFMLPEHKRIFSIIKDNFDHDRPISTGLEPSVIAEYSSDVATDIGGAIAVLKEKAYARMMIELLRSGIDGIMTGTPPDMTANYIISKLSEDAPVQDTLSDMGSSLHAVFKDIIAVMEGQKKLGLTTGLDFEKHLSGFEDGKLYIVAARPAMGKSAFALEIIKRVASQGVPVGMMSLEMSHTSLATRMLTAEMGLDGKKLRSGDLTESQVLLLQKSCEDLSMLPIYFDDNSYVTADSLRRRAIHLKRNKDIGMLVIDYLQLMTGDNDNRERDIAEISRTCKVIAKEMSIPVIALAQLNRGVEIRDNKRPRLSDLRESGAIEQDADAVMFLYRPEYYGIDFYGDDEDSAIKGTSTKNICEVIIGKNRDGETGIAQQVFIPELMQFKNRAPHLTSGLPW